MIEHEKAFAQLKWDESNCPVAVESDVTPSFDGDDWESITDLPPEWRLENSPSSNASLMNHLISGAQQSVASFLKTMGGSVRM